MRKCAELSNSGVLKLTRRPILSTSPKRAKLLQSKEALLCWWSETESRYGWLQQLEACRDLTALPGRDGKKESEKAAGERADWKVKTQLEA